ncbi:PilZ domain-containing protein [Mangrovimicrobium sediminis]|uniref:PilZ domain-containing protein n=1 Tax=Mangrovimicrobium sediminis TaxID=2562682 RepID=A0A4Z0M7P0_9GAMM|nr:PilZ domain-containing protein [Haliea sp. SAOS-164]TGD75702.1 PilZ domain-containing protein [Haliea sp. SAOS-164]
MHELPSSFAQVPPAGEPKRRFMRHPSDIPIQVRAEGLAAAPVSLHNMSLGGLCCETGQALDTGTPISIRIPLIDTDYEGHGVVVWCRALGARYEVGIQFVEEREAFKGRMVEQVCRIERYRRRVFEEEGRVLDGEQAAREWIARFAGAFAAAEADDIPGREV